MKITTRQVKAEVTFLGNGKLSGTPNVAISGGVPEPKLEGEASFAFDPEPPGESSKETVRQAFQVNLYGTSKAYRKLGEYFLSLAELDTSIDQNFHEHLQLTSQDGATGVHLILRKSDTGNFF